MQNTKQGVGMKHFLFILTSSIVLSAGPFKVWNFQTPDKTYVLQQQYEYWQRSKAGNPQGYNYQDQVTQFYVDGGMQVQTLTGGMQTVTNIGNVNNIEGDGNTVEQTHEGSQGGDNEATLN